MASSETNVSTQAKPEQPNADKVEYSLKNNFIKVLDALKEEMKNTLKEVEENTSKKLEEINNSFKESK